MTGKKTSLESSEWYEFRSGRTNDALKPYRLGHMFAAVYWHERGFTYAAIGRAVGVSGSVAKQMIDHAARVVRARDMKIGCVGQISLRSGNL